MGYEGGFTFHDLDGLPEGSVRVERAIDGDVMVTLSHVTGHGSTQATARFEPGEAQELAGALKRAAVESVELGEAS